MVALFPDHRLGRRKETDAPMVLKYGESVGMEPAFGAKHHKTSCLTSPHAILEQSNFETLHSELAAKIIFAYSSFARTRLTPSSVRAFSK